MEVDQDVNMPFVEKYRPNTLDDIVSHVEILDTINTFVEEQKMPHLMFYGPPGTGKTSTILAIAKKMFGERFGGNVLELNASDDRGIGIVRDQIKSFCSMNTFTSNIKLVILDECDAITSAAQFALRRVVEKYAKTTRFCLICNYVSKIIPALQSRCTRFRFAPLKTEHVKVKLNEICKAESLRIDQDAQDAIISLAGGDMRKVLNTLESAALAHDVITTADIYACTGKPSPEDTDTLLQSLLSDDMEGAVNTFLDIKEAKGLTLEDLVKDIHRAVMNIELDKKRKMYVVLRLAEIETRIAVGCSEKLQVMSLVGSFIEVRNFK
jgi:replication factor C subunit 3/5